MIKISGFSITRDELFKIAKLPTKHFNSLIPFLFRKIDYLNKINRFNKIRVNFKSYAVLDFDIFHHDLELINRKYRDYNLKDSHSKYSYTDQNTLFSKTIPS